MRKQVIISLVVGICAGVPHILPANEIHPNSGTSAFSFLTLGYEARSIAMGGAGTALPGDGSMSLLNPAVLGAVTATQFYASYHPYMAELDIHAGSLGAARPFSQWGTFAFNAVYLNAGVIDEIDETGTPTNTTVDCNNDFTGMLAWGKTVWDELRVGASFQWIYSRLDNVWADGFSFNAGAQYGFHSDDLLLGIAIRHLGSIRSNFVEDMARAPLPLTMSMGVSYRLRNVQRLRLAFDLDKKRDDYLNYRAGGEFVILKPFLTARAGYMLNQREIRQAAALLRGDEDELYQKTNWTNWSLGLNCKAPFKGMLTSIDVAYQDRIEDMTPAYIISLVLSL